MPLFLVTVVPLFSEYLTIFTICGYSDINLFTISHVKSLLPLSTITTFGIISFKLTIEFKQFSITFSEFHVNITNPILFFIIVPRFPSTLN